MTRKGALTHPGLPMSRMSLVRTRVASRDWWASRHVVSISSKPLPSGTHNDRAMRSTWSVEREHIHDPFMNSAVQLRTRVRDHELPCVDAQCANICCIKRGIE